MIPDRQSKPVEIPAQGWAVVGGGILGMTMARLLRESGHEVTIYEAGPRLGGLATSWSIGGIRWDRHYHVILNSDSYLIQLLTELGLDGDLVWKETRTACYSRGQVYSVSDIKEFLRFPLLHPLDRLRLGWTMFYASRIKDWRKLESVLVEDWLVTHSGRRAFEVFWKPLLKSKLGDNYTRASAAFIWAIIQRLYGARQSSMKREMFGYVHGGYDRILDVYEDTLEHSGVAIHTGKPIASVEPGEGRLVVNTSDGQSDVYDRVVITAPAPIAARLVPRLSEEEKTRLEKVLYQGIVCASFVLDRPLAGFYVTNLVDEAPFTGVIEMSSLVDEQDLGTRTLVYLPKYTTDRDPIRNMDDEEVIEAFTVALEEMYEGFDRSQIVAARVSRAKHVLPVSTLGYSAEVPAVVTSVRGVYVANSSQIVNGTLNVNETLQLAAKAHMEIKSEELKAVAESASVA